MNKIAILSENNLHLLFMFLLFACVVLSFYFFINTLFLDKKSHFNIFTAWQFPMLLALFIDVVYTQ